MKKTNAANAGGVRPPHWKPLADRIFQAVRVER
jgi:hypothetical protein